MEALLLFYVCIILGIAFGIVSLIRDSTTPERFQDDTLRKNNAKHSCKCYLEGLNSGEKEVLKVLAHNLDYKKYFIFNNLIIPSSKTKSSQIDHIVVSRFGIFVIESKDFSGWIFGGVKQNYWIQTLWGKKFTFRNPMHQNYGHIMALRELLPFASKKIYGIIVFSNKSNLQTEQIEGVVHLRDLIEFIKNYKTEQITESELQLVLGKLSYACQTVDIDHESHIANIIKRHEK